MKQIVGNTCSTTLHGHAMIHLAPVRLSTRVAIAAKKSHWRSPFLVIRWLSKANKREPFSRSSMDSLGEQQDMTTPTVHRAYRSVCWRAERMDVQ